MGAHGNKPFDGQVAIVTGGASGIGWAAAERLLADGAKVAIYDREVKADAPEGCLSLPVDITDEAAIAAATAQVVATWGRIDVLVNNAGVGAAGTVLQNDLAEWARVLDINVVGPVRVLQSVLPHIIASKGNVVNVASAVSLTGFPNRVLYTASKGAVLSMTRAMAADHLKDGVRFNAVCPGTTETPWINRLLSAADDPAAERAKLEARQPHGRLIGADEIADAIAYLASPRAGSTNGVTLSVDAGIESVYVAK